MNIEFLSVIIPVLNEEQVIGAVLKRIQAVLDEEPFQYEILVIDDGSTDDTAVAAENAGARVISHPYNIGNGAAVKTGIRNATGDTLLMLDGDGQHPPEDIPKLLKKATRYDMVVGARTHESDSAWHRDLANKAYNWLATYVTNHKIQDLTSGFRAIRSDIAREFVHLLPNTFSYPTTITMAILRSGYTLYYEPIISPKRVGKSKIKLFRDGSRFLMIIFKIATLFSPLKIFMPVSLFTFLLGIFYGGFKVVFLNTRYGPTSANLLITAVVIFLIGLISEQITYLRYQNS
ncbi:MAG: glycosyltransferase [Chloroflexi bacterium]|nr:glycosyltransferase [Chloroflexota bacterium]